MKKRTIFFLSALMIIFDGLVLCFGLWQGGVMATLSAKWEYFLILPILYIFTVLGHLKESKGYAFKAYVGKVLWNKDSNKSRRVSLDLIRCIAVLMVLLTHISAYQLAEATYAWQKHMMEILVSVSMLCNTLYIMISGSLAFSSKKEETPLRYYYGRLVSIIIPFFIAYFMMLLFYGWVDIRKPATILAGIKCILTKATEVAPHYWIIYVFMGLYLTVPLIKSLVVKLNDKGVRILSIAIIISEFVVFGLSYFGGFDNKIIEFIEWEGVFVLGFFLTERKDLFNRKLISGLAALSFIILITVSYFWFGVAGYLINTAPIGVFISAAILLFFTDREEGIKKKPHILIGMLSKYSYNIILLHWWTIFVFVVVHICEPKSLLYVGGIPCTLVASVIVCLGVAILFENTVNISIRYIFKRKKP